MSSQDVSPDRGDTIISIPPLPRLRPLLHDVSDLPSGEKIDHRQLKIRLANTEGRRSKAAYLIQRRYAWRGYESSGLPVSQASRITLAAFDGDQPIATISVRLDSDGGLGVEDLYPDQVRLLRDSNRQLCEFTRLAVDDMVRSKAVLAAIFHIAYIFAYRMWSRTDVLVEVNPRHVRFYQAALGFERLGEERMDERVGAPAVLLRLEFAHAEREIARLGGHAELAGQTRLLYPYFFSPREEQGISGRLQPVD